MSAAADQNLAAVENGLPEDRLAVVFGCAGAELTAEERDFLADARPLGFILFGRNCIDPVQVAQLVGDLRGTVGDAFIPVLIDQEGGRVERLKPPHWRHAPPARRFGDVWQVDHNAGIEAVRLSAALMADDLARLGITVDCAPVLDVATGQTHEAIGDRAFGETPAMVTALAHAVCQGLEGGGITPVIKHLPGHGRAAVDSHLVLPRIAASRLDLETVDFAPFRALADCPWGIVGHLLLEAIDPERPASMSPTVIRDCIRGTIGFNGVLASTTSIWAPWEAMSHRGRATCSRPAAM